MLAAALEAEVDAYLAGLAGERDERGRRLVVRNGYAHPRVVMTAAGAVQVRALRVNDGRVDEQTAERRRFWSVILPGRGSRRGPARTRCAADPTADGYGAVRRSPLP